MAVFLIDKQNHRTELKSGCTNYALPHSGSVLVNGLISPLMFINGDSYSVENGSKEIPIAESSLEIEADGASYTLHVLCGEIAEETKFDYNVFGEAYSRNLLNGTITERRLFSAFDEKNKESRLSLCTFNRKFDSITTDIPVEEMDKCAKKLPHIFQRPRLHLKQINEIRPASVVSRIGQESIRYLASHSEHWKGIRVSGLVPERLLARTLEDDCAIYENLAVKTLVDRLYRSMRALRDENLDCSMQMQCDDGHSVSSEQKSYYRARDLLLRDMDDDKLTLNQLMLEDQLEHIKNILDCLRKCRSAPLYRALKKYKPVTGRLKKTNIFMMDQYYKEAYRLWELMSKRNESPVENPAREITDEYEIFCKVIFVFALRFFRFEPDEPDADIMQNGMFLKDIKYSANHWHVLVNDITLDELCINAFEFEMRIEKPIEVNLRDLDIPDTLTGYGLCKPVRNGLLVFEKALDDKEQERLIKELEQNWTDDRKRKHCAKEAKKRFYTAFSNYRPDSASVLLIPWKYSLPDDKEEAEQTVLKVLEKVQVGRYNKCFLLTISRPNEYSNIKDTAALHGMLSYGWADSCNGIPENSFGVIPIATGDINSYRRLTKILLEQMIALDQERKICPICGQQLYQGQGSNIKLCRACGFQIIDTKCSSCGKKYTFTRYDPPKVTLTESDLPGFQVISEENKLGFKNITNMRIHDEQLDPVCPYCGHISE